MTTKPTPKAAPASDPMAEVLARLERLEHQNAALTKENQTLRDGGKDTKAEPPKAKPVLLIHPKGHDHVLCDEGSTHFERCSAEGYQPIGDCKSAELKTLLQSRGHEVSGQVSLKDLRGQVIASCCPQAKGVLG